MSVPSDRSFVEIHEDLLGFEIFLEAPWAKFAAEAGLFVAAPRRFDVRGLHVIDPHDASPQRFDDTEGFIDVTSPDGGGEAVRRVVGDANGVAFGVERDDGRNGTENFFAGDTGGIIDVVENRRLEIKAFGELRWLATADGDLCFFLAEVEVRSDAIVLFLADERAHLRFAGERRAEGDAFCFFSHR